MSKLNPVSNEILYKPNYQ